MKHDFIPLPAFSKSLKRLRRVDKDIPDEILAAIDILCELGELPPEYKDHALAGKYTGMREFHVRDSARGHLPSDSNDVLVIYAWHSDRLVILGIDAGSHDKLFSKGKGKT